MYDSVHSVLCNLTKVAPPKFTYFPFLPFHCETQKALIGRAFKQPTAFIKLNLSHFSFIHQSYSVCLISFPFPLQRIQQREDARRAEGDVSEVEDEGELQQSFRGVLPVDNKGR